jgi:hypothetical protein
MMTAGAAAALWLQPTRPSAKVVDLPARVMVMSPVVTPTNDVKDNCGQATVQRLSNGKMEVPFDNCPSAVEPPNHPSNAQVGHQQQNDDEL